MLASTPSTPSRRGTNTTFLGLSTLLLATLAFLMTLSSASASPTAIRQRDAFTDVRGTARDASLTSIGTRPSGAYARSIPITSASSIFTWYSKTPHNEADAESAFIIIHGIDRNANTYWTSLNNAWAKARDAGFGSARPNSIRVAPLFFSTVEDKQAYNSSWLAWGDSNAWTAGEGSTHPAYSGVSSFAVLDMFLDRFSNKAKYPKMKTITFVAHGGGAQMLQRYAVLGKANPEPRRLSVRYVVGDPSSELYFTQDRPVGVDTASCPTWNDYRYGINKYTAPYGSLSSSRAPSLFRAYAAKEVRYVVGLADTTSEDGDQSCMAHAAGGQKRRNRSLAYWKYIHLLSGGTDPDRVKNFPGTFPALDAKYGKTSQKNIPQSSSTVANRFRGVGVRHSLTTIDGVGHSATQIYGSEAGSNALFADQASSGSGNVPDLSKELNGFNATKAGAIDYGAGGGSSN